MDAAAEKSRSVTVLDLQANMVLNVHRNRRLIRDGEKGGGVWRRGGGGSSDDELMLNVLRCQLTY